MKFYKWVDGSWEVGLEIPDSELLESGMFRLEGEEVVLDTSKIFDVGLELESESAEEYEYCSEEECAYSRWQYELRDIFEDHGGQVEVSEDILKGWYCSGMSVEEAIKQLLN